MQLLFKPYLIFMADEVDDKPMNAVLTLSVAGLQIKIYFIR